MDSFINVVDYMCLDGAYTAISVFIDISNSGGAGFLDLSAEISTAYGIRHNNTTYVYYFRLFFVLKGIMNEGSIVDYLKWGCARFRLVLCEYWELKLQ